MSSLPVKGSALVQFEGDLLAVGGRDDSYRATSNVYKYDSHTDSWSVASRMKNRRSACLAVTLPGEGLMVVGGYTNRSSDSKTHSVEVLVQLL